MTLDEELDEIEQRYPKAWRFLMEIDPLKPIRPSFDDNDEMYFMQQEEKNERSSFMNVNVVETNLDFSSLSERSYTDQVVIHHTGCNDIDASAEQIHGWHINNGWSGIGYHYVIRKDGTIERGRPEWAIGSHAYGENNHTIGIHLSGDFEQAEPTQEQIEKCALLIADICERYSLPIDGSTIVGHGELMATSCPGKNLQHLIDNGTIIGKAIWYYNQEHGIAGAGTAKVEQEGSQQGGRGMERYNTFDAIPEWAQTTVRKLIGKGYLTGSGSKDENGLPNDLDLSRDLLRLLVINDRAGLY